MQHPESPANHPSPRPRVLVCLVVGAVFLASAAVGWLMATRNGEIYFRGRSARGWFQLASNRRGQASSLEAFRQLGTNTYPILVAAIAGKEDSWDGFVRRIYPRLPEAIQQRFDAPLNARQAREAALFFASKLPLDGIVPKLLPVLATPDSQVRIAVLQVVESRIRISDAGQIQFLCMVTNDPNFEIRIHAAWALWKMTGKLNYQGDLLKDFLSHGQDGELASWATAYVGELGGTAEPALISILTNSLRSDHKMERASACGCLGQLGPAASSAIPALQKALRDPSEDVRHRAEFSLKKIPALRVN